MSRSRRSPRLLFVLFLAAMVTVIVVGASGNVYEPGARSLHTEWTGAGYELSFPGVLFPEEAAWKLQVEVARTADASFREEEKLRFNGLRAAQPQASGSILPGEPEQWVSVPAGPRLGVRVGQTSAALPSVGLTVEGERSGLWFTLLEVRDDRGRPLLPWRGLEEVREFPRASGHPDTCQFEMPLKGIYKDTKSLDVTLAVTETRRLEFVAAPSRPGVRN
jgi:hypothetical protein